MKRTRVLLIAVICALGFTTSNVGAGQKRKIEKPRKQIGVRVLASPLMPVTLVDATARLVGKQTVLTYSISNGTSERLEAVDVAVFILDQSGYIIGGEGWEQYLDLKEHSSEKFPRILESKVSPGNRLVLAVAGAVGQAGEFRIEPQELVDGVKSPILGARRTSPSARYIRVSFQLTFCQKAQAQADAACKCGVQSFTCNESQNTFSYTCFPRTNCVLE